MAQAKSYGYKTPEFSIGGQFNYANAFAPTFNKTVNIPSPTYSKLPQRSIGGFVKGIASAAGSIFGGPAVGAAMGMLGNVAGAAQNITKAAMPVISSVIPGGNITGKFLSMLWLKLKLLLPKLKQEIWKKQSKQSLPKRLCFQLLLLNWCNRWRGTVPIPRRKPC